MILGNSADCRKELKIMKCKVEFLWWASRKVWEVAGNDIDDIINKCDKLCYKYHAIHYQILD